MITEYNNEYFGLMDQIRKHKETQNEVADEIGMSRPTFNVKLHRKYGRDFKLSESRKICDALHIDIDSFY